MSFIGSIIMVIIIFGRCSCDFENQWTLTKLESNLFVWVPLVVKKYAHTIEGPCQWILPIKLQTKWKNGEGRR
jgi:hypothetical protein